MAFNYGELTRIQNDIIADTDRLEANLKDFSALINENVNNSQVWQGASSVDFKSKWDEFEQEKFPQYKSHFNKEINNVGDSIAAWSQSEGQ